jgi:hypothetical protein
MGLIPSNEKFKQKRKGGGDQERKRRKRWRWRKGRRKRGREKEKRRKNCFVKAVIGNYVIHEIWPPGHQRALSGSKYW